MRDWRVEARKMSTRGPTLPIGDRARTPAAKLRHWHAQSLQLKALTSVASVPELLAHIAQNVERTPSRLYAKAKHLAADLLLALNR